MGLQQQEMQKHSVSQSHALLGINYYDLNRVDTKHKETNALNEYPKADIQKDNSGCIQQTSKRSDCRE